MLSILYSKVPTSDLLVEPAILLAALVARPRGVLLREHALVVVADHKEEGQVVPANHHRSQGLKAGRER